LEVGIISCSSSLERTISMLELVILPTVNVAARSLTTPRCTWFRPLQI